MTGEKPASEGKHIVEDVVSAAEHAASAVRNDMDAQRMEWHDQLQEDKQELIDDIQRDKRQLKEAVDDIEHPSRLWAKIKHKMYVAKAKGDEAIVYIEHPAKVASDVRQGIDERRQNIDHAAETLTGEFSGPIDHKKLPVLLKVFGVLAIIGGVAALPMMVRAILSAVALFRGGAMAADGTSTIVVTFIQMGIQLVIAIMFVFLGIRMLRNKRRWAAFACNVLYVAVFFGGLCSIMLEGMSPDLVFYLITVVLLIALQSYLDPSLLEERRLHRKLREMDDRARGEEGTLGLDLSGRGYITLNFFNLFWIFVVASMIGLLVEEVFHFLVVVPGEWQDRAGLLFGPFSPIYGCGALLMTLFLNRFHKSNFIIIFFVAAVIGGAFEYCASLFMQYAFGAVAWNYTGMWLSIGGRTCGLFMAMWGVLGVIWIKLFLPLMLRLVNLIPWNLRYTLTTVAAVLMCADIVMTLQSLDCWYERLSGTPVTTPIQQFYAHDFDDAYMADRFQSMSIIPDDAVRHG